MLRWRALTLTVKSKQVSKFNINSSSAPHRGQGGAANFRKTLETKSSPILEEIIKIGEESFQVLTDIASSLKRDLLTDFSSKFDFVKATKAMQCEFLSCSVQLKIYLL